MLRKKPISPEAARLRMADLCARGEHCEYEIAEKLRKLGQSSSDIKAILEFLEEGRFIDNARFASAFARDKVRFSGWGRRKIRMALAMKRISSADISEALESIDPRDYSEALSRAALSKSRSLDLEDYDDRNRLFAALARRGFEPDMISARIASIRRERKEEREE